jgi:hypothetical protein
MMEDLEPNPDPYLWLTDQDANPGGPKTSGFSGSGSATLAKRHKEVKKQ